MKRRAFLLSGFAAAMLAGVLPRSSEAQAKAPSAEAILEQMQSAYAVIQSYTDQSVATYRNPDGSERLHADFRIWFIRNASFRIDAESRSPDGALPRREVMWTQGTTVRSWTSGKAVTTRPKVQFVGTGMFGAYAYHVPTLLDESYGSGTRLDEMASPEVVGEETIEDTNCLRVRGSWHGDTYELWIGKDDHLIHKLR
ncbi:MAG: hypothetical protein M3Y80_01930, partial [Verrucomicrobiota bacterium]|nr:hypothetical protein [Verrucomicrobiota bacterium]